jgi:predicted phosphohydrolase
MTTKVRRTISIQVFSDIHIELWNKIPEIPVRAKYLFLAGDICYYNHPLFFPFLDYCSLNWSKVFYIPGNHEYYIKNYNELEFEYKYKIGERYKNVYYLNNNFVTLDEENINIYGSTFWTIPPFTSTYQAKNYINDYNIISYFKKSADKVVDLDITYVSELANESFNSLQNYLNETNMKTIIMTHFPPHTTGTSHPKYFTEKKTIKSYFAWPDITLQSFRLDNVLTWISGHTHWSYDFYQNNIRLLSNQLGYKNEVGHTGLDENGLFEINVS